MAKKNPLDSLRQELESEIQSAKDQVDRAKGQVTVAEKALLHRKKQQRMFQSLIAQGGKWIPVQRVDLEKGKYYIVRRNYGSIKRKPALAQWENCWRTEIGGEPDQSPEGNKGGAMGIEVFVLPTQLKKKTKKP